ncbi:amino acid ABC transporter permease [Labrys monachus]|uniref:Polar amino acid transport system permease protein n=1 Tax=Labrys monachus TaxID=217067 RepID=A0ABU0FED2_9HYPH|nr:amino acid ABC transporter permease [Labrys monachus]MDQ0392791.1 polar amino acid transport system permease protein [Labrys monachus]
MDFRFLFDFLIDPPPIVWEGLLVTIYISVAAQAAGVALGLGIALARRSRLAWLRLLAGFYVWFWRGTPLLVQLLLAYTGVAAAGIYRYPDIEIGPLALSGPIQAAVLTLAFNEGAYMSEIFRGAIQTIDRGQFDAARALGMTPATAFRWIVLPQALRVVIPPLGNEFTLMIKGTSLLSIIGVREFFGTLQDINSATFKTFELFLFAAIWYLLLTTILGFGQKWLEHRMARHETPLASATAADLSKRSLLGGRR